MDALGDRPTPDADFPRAERAVLFTDIVGSTRYFEQYGDMAGVTMVRRHNELLLPKVANFGGTVIKTIGDAIMAGFEQPDAAILAAASMQRALRSHNAEQPEGERIHVRIGIHFGSVVLVEGDLYGDVVNAAARVEALARAEQILISAELYEQLPATFALPCASYDAVRVKGKREPLEVFEVLWEQGGVRIDLRAPLRPGEILGERFEVGVLLGEGGMGQVHLAKDLALSEDVALKFMRADLARDEELLARFKEEVRLTRSLTHPNICRVHEFFEMDGHAFLSMELLKGRTLTEVIAEGAPLPERRIRALAAGILEGLAHAHARGIVHRDLKPANVMLEVGTDRVVLMDFGIAALARSGRGEIAGTPEYMSPEQVRGEPVSPASDVYSVGVILYEMLAGRPPHSGRTPMATGMLHLSAEPAPLDSKVASTDLRALVTRCLAKPPEARFASAAELKEALSPTEPVLPRPRLSRRRWSFLAGFALAALGVGVGLSLLPDSATEAQSDAPDAALAPVILSTRPLVSSAALEWGGRFSRDGKAVAFVRDEGLFWQDARGTTRKAELLDSPALGDVALGLVFGEQELLVATESQQGVAITRVPLDGKRPVEVKLRDAAAIDASRDGRQLAFVQTNPSGIGMASADGQARRLLLPAERSRTFESPRFSPDGRTLAVVVHQAGFESTRDIGLVDIATQKLTLLTEDGLTHKFHNTDPAWTPDGKALIYASKRSGRLGLWRVAVTGGASIPLTQGSVEEQRRPDVAPDGRILFSSGQTLLDIAELELTTGAVQPLTKDAWPDRFPVFTPDGRVAFRTQGRGQSPDDASILELNPWRGDILVRPEVTGLRDFCYAGGDLVFAATQKDSQGREVRRLGLMAPDGQVRVLVDDYFRLWTPACRADGKQVAFVGMTQKAESRRLWVLDLPDGKPMPLSGPKDGLYSHPDYSPDGKTLAVRYAPEKARLGEAILRLVTVETGAKRDLAVPGFAGAQRRLRYAPDGASVLYMVSHGRAAEIWQASLSDGRAAKVASVPEPHTYDFDLSPDGRRVVYARSTRTRDLYLLEPTRALPDEFNLEP